MLYYVSESYFRCKKVHVIFFLALCVFLYVVIMVSEEEAAIKSVQVPWLKIPPDKVYIFSFDNEKIIQEIDKRFLSFSIDTSQIYKGLRNPSLKDKGLRRRIKHLSGGYLRVGGTAADMLVFSPALRGWPERILDIDGGKCSYESIDCEKNKPHRKFLMSAENWHDINDFCTAVELRLLFDLNVLFRKGNFWNSSNARTLIDYSNAYQFSLDWQLGNEPNSFRHVFGTEVQPDQLAQDFNTLHNILIRYAKYNSSKLVGPDVTNPQEGRRGPMIYFSNFLDAQPEISAATWHHYYTGPDTPLSTLLNISLYDEFENNCKTVVTIVKNKMPNKPIWITETGSAYGGGMKNLSDRFVASLLWLDKLGVAAREGISVVVRQSLYTGTYALLNSDTLSPNPDYWVSILYKHLVGRKVFRVKCENCGEKSALRVYGHCSKSFPRLLLYGINLDSEPVGLKIPLNETTAAFLYSLTAPTLDSKLIELNGIKLYLTFTDGLPRLKPILVTLSKPIVILPYSIFFLDIDSFQPICL